jgi:hypothetical protein
MGKKTRKLEYSLMPMQSIDDVKVYHVMADSGDGYQHEYTIKVLDVESGTLYSMAYSDSIAWSQELRGVSVFHLLNTGDGYEWIDTNPMHGTVQYDEFYLYSVFFRVIQELESHSRYNTKILEVSELTSFNY